MCILKTDTEVCELFRRSGFVGGLRVVIVVGEDGDFGGFYGGSGDEGIDVC